MHKILELLRFVIRVYVVAPALTLHLSCASTTPFRTNSHEKVLEQYISNNNPVSYASHLKLYFNSERWGSAKTEALVYFKSPGIYSFIVKDFWGKNIVSGTSKGDSILVYYPQERCFIRDKVENFSGSKYWDWKISPLQLFNLLNGQWPIKHKETHFVELSGDIIRYETFQDAFRIDLFISRHNAALTELRISDRDNDWTGTVKLKRIKNHDGFNRPGLVEIEFEGSKDAFKAGVVEEKLNLELPEKYFNLQIPGSAKKIELDGNEEQ
ncbi:MAG: hypothetical protein L0Y74_00570 [candidate division Zixibacteria bacterium]|nr:hypothetical protein [candidate division Zixibacteria bacterium]